MDAQNASTGTWKLQESSQRQQRSSSVRKDSTQTEECPSVNLVLGFHILELEPRVGVETTTCRFLHRYYVVGFHALYSSPCILIWYGFRHVLFRSCSQVLG